MPILRYYQDEAATAIEWGWELDNRVGAKLPTGSGKTVMVADLFGRMQPGRCLFLADQDELCQQPRIVIQKFTGIIPALEKAKEQASLKAQVVVASSQTLSKKKRLERFPRDHFDYIVSDEVHRGTSRDAQIWDYFETAKVCGVTATPYRSNLADLSKWFSNMVYEMDILDLVEEGFAPPPLLLNLPVEIDVSKIAERRSFEGKDYDLDSVDSAITPYYAEIAELVRDNAKGYHGIAYLPLIKSSEAFAAVLRSMGVRALHIDGTSDNRDEIIQAFSRGEIDWLTNSNLLSTGVDIPICDAFLNLRLTKSRSWYQQARGRALRVLPGVIDHLPEKNQAHERRTLIAASQKPHALIFDLLCQHESLSAIRAADDFVRNEHDAQALFEASKNEKTPQDIAELAKRVQQEREAALVDALERAAIRSGLAMPVLAKEMAALLGRKDIVEYVPIQRWELESPTPQQLDILRERGVDVNSVKTKGEASAVIGMIVSRGKMGYSSFKQVKMIRQFDDFKPEKDRIANPETLSKSEASRIIDENMAAKRRSHV